MEHTENIKQNSLHQWDILISAIKITFYELKKKYKYANNNASSVASCFDVF